MKKIFQLFFSVNFALAMAQTDINTIRNFLENQSPCSNPDDLPSSYRLYNSDKPQNLAWSILIPTLVERATSFEQIFSKLLWQIEAANLQDQVEILFFRDNREANVGYKRNQLIAQASGKYTCFVDDDDDVIDNYVQLIYQKLLEDCDCVKLVGIYHEIGRFKKTFIHSMAYTSYFEKPEAYYRPPNHLNPIKREIAVKFKFPDKDFGEDTDWALQICKAQAIQSESPIETPYYYYNFDLHKSVSWQKVNKIIKR